MPSKCEHLLPNKWVDKGDVTERSERDNRNPKDFSVSLTGNVHYPSLQPMRTDGIPSVSANFSKYSLILAQFDSSSLEIKCIFEVDKEKFISI